MRLGVWGILPREQGCSPPQVAGGGQPLRTNKADGFADTAQEI